MCAPSVRLARARSLVAGKRRMAELRHELRHELVSSQAPSSHGTPPTPRQQLRIEVPQHDRATDGQAIFLIACQCDGQRWTVVRKERSVSELHAALQPSTSCPTLHSRSAAGSGGARRGTAGLATQAQRLQEYLTELARDGQWRVGVGRSARCWRGSSTCRRGETPSGRQKCLHV